MMARQSRIMRASQVLVVGCGSVGASIASKLSARGYDVTVIDSSQADLGRLTDDFTGFTELGRETSCELLESCGIRDASMVLAFSERDNTNILVAELARRIYGVREVYARLFDDSRGDLLAPFGIEVLSPRQLCEDEFSRLSGIALDDPADVEAETRAAEVLAAEERGEGHAGRPHGKTDAPAARHRQGMHVLVMGANDQAFYMTGSLLEGGHRETAVCESHALARRFADSYDAVILQGDPSDPDTLAQVDTSDIDVAVALAELDEKNFVSCQVACELYDIPKTVCTVHDPRNVEAFRALGVSLVFSATYDFARMIGQASTMEDVAAMVAGNAR